ncbi:MAG: rhomboid family intramembrane serine protease [Nanoarchaeota archaeon]|nr:rhomboid family intramembrane serine protease [Nanoarchaeota archaeon]
MSLPIFLWIIVFTSIISIAGFVFLSLAPSFADSILLVPQNIFNGQSLWTLLTHVFFHADFLHLFVNMFSLLFIGSVCETIIGRKRFFWFYLVAGFFGGLFFIASAYLGSLTGLTSVLGDLNFAGVGASGALFGLLGILAVIIPHKKVYLISGPIILIIVQILLPQFISGAFLTILDVVLTILLFTMIFSLFYPSDRLRKFALPLEMPIWIAPIIAIVPLVLISFFVSLPIGNSAHFGGLVAGIIYGAYLRFNYPRKVEMIGRVFR